MFRFSGLAHLLAILGPNMGLLCFGVIGFARKVMAIMPGVAVRLQVHKYAALTGLMAAALYVVLSGGVNQCQPRLPDGCVDCSGYFV